MKGWVIGAMAGLVAVVVGLMALDVSLMAQGCGSIDPTDANNYSEVIVRNDTSQPVVLSDCEGSYCQVEPPRTIAPGAELREEAACAASGTDMTSWRVSRANGTPVFIAINTPKKHDGLVYLVSKAAASRRIATPSLPPTTFEHG